MRYMLLMIPRGFESVGPKIDLDPEAVARMMEYTTAMAKAGILITCDGLHPPSVGARVTFESGKPVVTDGPFAEAREVLGGYWMIEVASRDEAIAWAAKCPGAPNEIVEVRRVQEIEDFAPDVQEVAAEFSEMQARKRRD